MNVTRVGKPHGKIQHPLLSKLPSLVEESFGHFSSDQSVFIHECGQRLLRTTMLRRVNRCLTLGRDSHGWQPVELSGESMLFLITDIVEALRAYACDEHVWDYRDEGDTYRCLMEAAKRIDPADPSFYYLPRVEPVRTTRNLRELAKELRQLAKKNKVQWTPEKTWQAFLTARRKLVARLWVTFEVHTQPLDPQHPGLSAYGQHTAIYKWIANILSTFQIYTKEQKPKALWKTIRHDRDSESYKTNHLALERSYREALTHSLLHRRQLLTTVLDRRHT